MRHHEAYVQQLVGKHVQKQGRNGCIAQRCCAHAATCDFVYILTLIAAGADFWQYTSLVLADKLTCMLTQSMQHGITQSNGCAQPCWHDCMHASKAAIKQLYQTTRAHSCDVAV